MFGDIYSAFVGKHSTFKVSSACVRESPRGFIWPFAEVFVACLRCCSRDFHRSLQCVPGPPAAFSASPRECLSVIEGSKTANG